MGDVRILDEIAATFLGVAGLNDDAVYSAGGGEIVGVKDLPDRLADGAFPAVVVLSGEKSIIPGPWERTTWTVEASVWVPDIAPRSEAYRTLLAVEEPIRQAFRAHDRAGASDPAVQSVLITGTDAIVGRQWARGDAQPWFLVLPISFEVKVNRAVQYQPQPR